MWALFRSFAISCAGKPSAGLPLRTAADAAVPAPQLAHLLASEVAVAFEILPFKIVEVDPSVGVCVVLKKAKASSDSSCTAAPHAGAFVSRYVRPFHYLPN